MGYIYGATPWHPTLQPYIWWSVSWRGSKHRVTTTAHPLSQLVFPAILWRESFNKLELYSHEHTLKLDRTVLPFPSGPMMQSSPCVKLLKYDITPDNCRARVHRYNILRRVAGANQVSTLIHRSIQLHIPCHLPPPTASVNGQGQYFSTDSYDHLLVTD